MPTVFETEYHRLNAAQKQAVDTIDGPMLVIAGPGTGKTQLLSVRVANILNRTDVLPANILCLTFTDNAARNMRERLEAIIGRSAAHVAIHTFHSFGADVIQNYADYFMVRRPLVQQIDELGRYELLHSVFEQMDHDNPLSARVGDDFIFLPDTLTTISWLKQNAITPAQFREILANNQSAMERVSTLVAETFLQSPSLQQKTAYITLLDALQADTSSAQYGFPSFAALAAAELRDAVDNLPDTGRYAPPITVWRNQWCAKQTDGRYAFKDSGKALRKLFAVADAYDALLALMSTKGLYDFDDMIMETVQAFESDDELRLNVQERYQYILVDEFQDTNKAQLRLLYSLGDNPVNEERPNIMAVGDDDQAIYAFQGAEVSNMLAFTNHYRDTKVITLINNYRSTPTILEASGQISTQLTDRLSDSFDSVARTLEAQAKHPLDKLQYTQFQSELAQYDWIAKDIAEALAAGQSPESIAVIAPRHRSLERLMPYLGRRRIPVAYERRENILDAPIISQLLTMSALVVALAEQRHSDANHLAAEVLSYPFWGISAAELLSYSLACYAAHQYWHDPKSYAKQPAIARIMTWFIELSGLSNTEPLEYMLDALVGGVTDRADNEFDALAPIAPHQKSTAFISPMRAYYFSEDHFDQTTDTYLSLLGQLSSLRQKLREWRPNIVLRLSDVIEFVALHNAAHIKIIDTNPHTQTTKAVQVLTAYKAKGLEFDRVYLINVQDEVWGPTARSRRASISLPRNVPLAPPRDSDNDRLRLLYVAMTRARQQLELTGYTHTLANKPSPQLSLILDITALEPKNHPHTASVEAVEILATDWQYRFRSVIADKPTLFEPLLATYKLSVTHLNNFIDVVGAGPEYFLLHNLLRFPEAPSPSAAYGDAIHKTMQWIQAELKQNRTLPNQTSIDAYFVDIMSRKQLRAADQNKLQKRGLTALHKYLAERGSLLTPDTIVERGFKNEGVVIEGARLSGKIDKLLPIDASSYHVIDIKTGKPAVHWTGKDEFERAKLHKYRQQLLFYKLLVEGSASFSKRATVTQGALEFIEPNEAGDLVDNLTLEFDAYELERFAKLIGAVWEHIARLDFPDVSAYPKNLKGIQAFEQDLIDGVI